MLVAEQEDGTLVSTPFIVKLKGALKDTQITLLINGAEVEPTMYINKYREGCFREKATFSGKPTQSLGAVFGEKMESPKCNPEL